MGIAAAPFRSARPSSSSAGMRAGLRRKAAIRSRVVLAERAWRPATAVVVEAAEAAHRTRAAADIQVAVEAITAKRLAAHEFSISSLRPGRAPPSEFGPSFFGGQV